MFKNDVVVKEYYKIMLLFGVQMMFLTNFVINNFMKTHVYTPAKIQIVTEMGLGVIVFFNSIASIFVVKKLYKTAQEQYVKKIHELKYANIEEQSKIQQQHKHDLLNHLNVLSVLAQDKRYVELDSYLCDYRDEINNVLVSVDTGLQEMDILLYSKINAAHRKNIVTNFKCTASIECKKRYIINLISILGNLLDNALEASEESEERLMSIYIKEDPIDYSILIQNSFRSLEASEPQILFQEGFSTRGPERGRGLSIVRKLVDKFEGTISLDSRNRFFEVRVDLPKHRLKF